MIAGADLCFLPATELVRRLRDGDISAREVVGAHLARIEHVNPAVNAIVTLVADRALERAAWADEAMAHGEPTGRLHGVPIAHKDLVATAGIRTTSGSPIFADTVPDADDLLVERAGAAGVIVLGKTNTPEFGAGSQTFNPVFGATRNPYDLTKTCGGSSGGAAVALACGMVPIADGSDLGGSLRNPASFCNVVGFRPTPGRVPSWPSTDVWQDLSVEGPMARTVEDAALLLSVLSGPDPRVPISRVESGAGFAPPLDADLGRPVVAWAPAADGAMPFDPCIPDVVDGARGVFESLGCRTDDAFPDVRDAREVFLTMRAHMFAGDLGELLVEHRRDIKATVVWNIEQGLQLTGADLARAERMRTDLVERAAAFFARYDFLVMPVTQVVPFDVRVEFPTEIDGVAMATYLDWMESCWCITVMGSPAISVPCGFSHEGLPVGLQIVGRRGDDLGVLQLAHAFERATRVGDRRPPEPA
ncbi:MAG TPA: amidase [Actinomycetota bacterium]|nr:amidase [Actinomycetota bacterium]